MAQAPKTVFTYPLNGTQRDFPIAFEYLARKFVRVTLLGTNARRELVLNTDYRFTTKVQITTTQAWGAAEGYDTIEIRRYTSAEERLVDFNDGSILRAFDLNLSQIQTLHVAEEARDLTADTISVNQDGDLDARGRKIVNLANGINDTDAANVGQLRQYDNSTANNADRAEAAKNRAVQAETNTVRDAASASVNATKAIAAAGTAVQAASDANQSYSKIVPLEQSTVANAQVATQQAQRAQNEADRAKTEADKLGNMTDFAGTLSKVSGEDPFFKHSIILGDKSASSNVQFLSRPDLVTEPTRKGFVGIPSDNSKDIWVMSDSGDVKLVSRNSTVRVSGVGGDVSLETSPTAKFYTTQMGYRYENQAQGGLHYTERTIQPAYIAEQNSKNVLFNDGDGLPALLKGTHKAGSDKQYVDWPYSSLAITLAQANSVRSGFYFVSPSTQSLPIPNRGGTLEYHNLGGGECHMVFRVSGSRGVPLVFEKQQLSNGTATPVWLRRPNVYEGMATDIERLWTGSFSIGTTIQLISARVPTFRGVKLIFGCSNAAAQGGFAYIDMFSHIEGVPQWVNFGPWSYLISWGVGSNFSRLYMHSAIAGSASLTDIYAVYPIGFKNSNGTEAEAIL